MNKQDQLRDILSDIQSTKGFTSDGLSSGWQKAKDYACELLVKSPCTMDKWLTRGGQDIPDNELKLLKMLWEAEK
jgi:hypothetical protein